MKAVEAVAIYVNTDSKWKEQLSMSLGIYQIQVRQCGWTL